MSSSRAFVSRGRWQRRDVRALRALDDGRNDGGCVRNEGASLQGTARRSDGAASSAATWLQGSWPFRGTER